MLIRFRNTVSHFRRDILSSLLALMIIVSSCERLEIKRITKVSTGSVSEITAQTSIVQGNVIEQGETAIKQHGHCWSVSSNPSTSNYKTELGARSTTGSFNSALVELSANTKYYVRAYATDNEGTSYGDEISFITLTIPVPLPPDSLEAWAESSSQITIVWKDNSNNEDGFKIEILPGGGASWNEIATVGADITIFQSAGLSASTSYSFRVKAFNTGGNSGYSNVARATTPSEVVVPLAPTNLITQVKTETEINLSWTDNSNNEAGFKIEISSDGEMSWDLVDSTKRDTTHGIIIGLSPGTPYSFRVFAYNAQGNSEYSNIASATTCTAPVAITTQQTNIGTTIVTLHGTVNPNNYFTDVIFEYGPTPDLGFAIPAIQSPLTGINDIEVSAEVTDLSPNSQYYYRVKAVNCGGTTYGDNLTFATDPLEVYDMNDNVYHVMRIGTQLWTIENLKATTPWDASGDVPLIADGIEWSNMASPGYCWYNNDARYKDIYGALYNWWAVSWRRLCPVDWHVPTESDWRVFANFLGGESIAGGKMKEAGLNHWLDPNIDATNESGFTALPGGYRAPDGIFYLVGSFGEFWTSSENSLDDAWFRSLGYNVGTLGRGYDSKKAGYSIRCIRD